MQEELRRLHGQEYDTFIAELKTAEGLSKFLINAGVSGLVGGGTAMAAKNAGVLNKIIQVANRLTLNSTKQGGGGEPLLNVADEVARMTTVGNGISQGIGDLHVLRNIEPGEKLADIVNDAKVISFQLDQEVALVKLGNGRW